MSRLVLPDHVGPVVGGKVTQYVIDELGITEVDIRSIRPFWSIDAYEVRLWNRRRLTVSCWALTRWSARQWKVQVRG